jgi:prepilin-type N-terminal cleavage/methylation domain-containing protein
MHELEKTTKGQRISSKISDSVSSRISRTLRRESSRKFSAFTLAELIVVVSILAVLATIGFLALSGYQKDAKDAVAKANVRSVYTAISSESAVTGYSSRYYVVHDPAYALSGAIVVFDGNPTNLVGGNWDTPGTNYSAGNPDYSKLKLDPAKFRTASANTRTSAVLSRALAAAFGFPASAEVLTDPSLLVVGAADATDGTGASTRVRSYSQVTALLPSGEAAVAGDYPPALPGGSAAGLVKDLADISSTGALVDGAKTG